MEWIKAAAIADAAGEMVRTVLSESFFDTFAAEVLRIYATELWRDNDDEDNSGPDGG